MDQRLSVVTLGVANLDRSQRFYETGLGWTVGSTEEQIRFFQLNGVIFALYPWEALAEDAGLPARGSGFSGVTLAYCARSRTEVEDILKRAEQAGARIVKPAQEVFWGGYSGYFADLDGHLWEVAHNPFWHLDAKGNVSLEVPDA
ncbi:VOC family protein [Desulfoluna butyratoxydans]|uniref:Glyoxalase/bleomycin resistance protein/dihydroxybiphenyl dioxygenase n=1 Tax=Desulfoluna butyratoxydans TaxID=231438 RepID=A0A4U8YH17_9BACT|nr:VOC family protein [Desulfoluna butyratoxydans]VFQ42811.1 glyoxalase/bleomycin resistance protein/dihydroxybiphenyl dioxygenase [Desulfoluna butyratoxydans]